MFLYITLYCFHLKFLLFETKQQELQIEKPNVIRFRKKVYNQTIGKKTKTKTKHVVI